VPYGAPSGCPHGGLGGRGSAVIPVEPQERLVIVVGGAKGLPVMSFAAEEEPSASESSVR
jgi:hypothetical protein